jgi:hypothetical protein
MEADLGDGVGIGLSQLKISLDSLCPLDEKTYRCYTCQIRKYGKLREVGHGQGRDSELMFPRKVQSGPAGYENAEVVAGCQQISQLRCSRHHLLEVVEQQQELLLPQILL